MKAPEGGLNPRSVLTATLIVVAVVLSLAFLFLIRQVLIFLVLAVVIASALKPPVDWLNRRGLPRFVAVLIIYLGVVALLGLIVWVVVPPLIEQGRALIENLPAYADSFELWRQEAVSAGWPLGFIPSVSDVLNNISSVLPTIASGALDFAVGFVAALFGLFSALVITFYWLLERDRILRYWLDKVPENRATRVRSIWEQIEGRVGGWLRGQLVLCATIGIMALIGLSILGVKYAVFLAVIAGLLEAVPILGPWLSGIPAVAVALTVSPLLAILVVVLYVVIQQLENNIIVPKVMERAVGISPLTVLVSMLIGGTLFGIAGIILAVPVASGVHVIIEHGIFPRQRIDGPTEAVPAKVGGG